MSKTVSSVSSALALKILEEKLLKGEEISIPSLGIKFIMRNGKVIQLPIEEEKKVSERK